MYRIDDATATPAVPTPEAAGAEGFFTEGNAAAGTPATNVRGSWLNMVQEELRNIVTAAGLTPSKTTYTQVLQAIRAMTADTSRVQGLRGANGTTVASQMAWSADAVTLRNPTNGGTAAVSGGTGTITTDISVAGPSANGRDQAAVFPASSWLHFYFIWNPTTASLASIASLQLPTAGPVMPTGYTAFAYIGAVYLGSGSALPPIRFRGSWAQYLSPIAAVSGGTATSLTGVSLVSVVPPNGLQMKLQITQLGVASNSSGVYSANLQILTEATGQSYQTGIQGTGSAAVIAYYVAGGFAILPIISQGFNYLIGLTTGTSPTVTILINGYSVPNGGE